MDVGDIVNTQDNDAPRGIWKLGRVSEAIAGVDGKVRKIEVQYKINKNQELSIIHRAVQGVVVILPNNEQN